MTSVTKDGDFLVTASDDHLFQADQSKSLYSKLMVLPLADRYFVYQIPMEN